MGVDILVAKFDSASKISTSTVVLCTQYPPYNSKDGWVGKTCGIHSYGPEFGTHVFGRGRGGRRQNGLAAGQILHRYKLEWWCVDCSLYHCVTANLRISPSLLRTRRHKEPAVSAERRENARDRGGLWSESDMTLILDWVVCNFSELELRSSIWWLSAELSSHYA